MIANFGGYYIHPSKAVKFGVLVLTADSSFLRFGTNFWKMAVRLSLFFAMCFMCGLGILHAQAPNLVAAQKTDDAYMPLKKCWEYRVENIGRSTVSASNGTVYLAETGGRVRALNVRNGSVNWVSDLGGNISALHAIPTVGVVAVTAAANGVRRSTLRLLNKDSGLVRYSISLDAGGDVYLISSGSRLIVFDPDGSITGLNLQDGAASWQFRLPSNLSAAPAAFNSTVIAATVDKKITILAVDSGNPLGSFSTERTVNTLAVRENGMLVVGDDRGRVTNYRDNTGNVWWKFNSGARVGTISETEEGLLIGSYDNFIYMVSKYTGDVKWKKRLDGRILFSPAVLDSRIVSASSTEQNAQVIEIGSGKPVDRIDLGEERFMLSQPYVSEGNMVIFTVVDGIIAFAPNGCT